MEFSFRFDTINLGWSTVFPKAVIPQANCISFSEDFFLSYNAALSNSALCCFSSGS